MGIPIGNWSALSQSNIWKERSEAVHKVDFDAILKEGQKFSSGGNAGNDKSNLWAQVVEDGKVLAKVYKDGIVESYKEVSLDPDGSASERAAQALQQLGGELMLFK